MKYSTGFFCPFGIAGLLIFGNCAVAFDGSTTGIFPRQLGYASDADIKTAPIYSVENLTPKTNHPNAFRKKIRFGPYTVPGSNEASVGKVSDKQDKLGAIVITNKIESLCGGDCSILWGVGIPEYENGTRLTATGASIYNHHVFALNHDRLVSMAICPGDSMPSEKFPDTVINSQNDQEVTIYTSSDYKVKSGYAIKSTDRIDLLAEFMNYRPEKASINVAFDFEYVPGKPEGFLNSVNIMLDAAPCGHMGFNPPTKQYSITSKEWILPTDLTLINARGHQHDGGIGMEVFVNGTSICKTVPTYVKTERPGQNQEVHYGIKEMSLCQPETRLKKGDALVIRSDYDIEKYPQRQSNTGYIETVTAILSVILGLPTDFNVASL